MTRTSTLIAAALMTVGGAAALRTLTRGRQARAQDRTAAIVVELDDVTAVSIRTGMPPADLLGRLRASGATRCTLPERTLRRLLDSGRMFQTSPPAPLAQPPPFGHWVYLASADRELAGSICAELQARLPQIQAVLLPGDAHTLALAGDLATVGSIGLGFDAQAADVIHRSGLRVVPRPVSYDWHEPTLIERSLAQAAEAGDGIVAFDGALILGHEMHLAVTLAALEKHGLTFAYFAESRHQRGDWFIAKRRVPHVVLAHQFTPAQMIPEDFHSIAHHWANLARERGVRMIFANFFRVVHASEPLECLKYLEHIRGALEAEGVSLENSAQPLAARAAPALREVQPRARHLESLAPVGAGALAVTALLGLREGPSIALASAAAVGTLGAGSRLDRTHDALERQYAPVYASKLFALAAAALAPLAAVGLARTSEQPLEALLLDSVIGATTAAAVSALTSSDEYRLRIEEYKGFDLEVWLPAAAALISYALPARRPASRAHRVGRASSMSQSVVRAAAGLALAAGGWYATRRLAPDPAARFDLAPAMSHTHHLSAAMRRVGDTLLAAGPRPIRKWAGLGPFGLALAIVARKRRLRTLALAGMLLSVAGHAAAITGFRRPERDPLITAKGAGTSWLAGVVAGAAVAHMLGTKSAEEPDLLS